MYELHYLVPTAEGFKKEHVIRLATSQDYRNFMEKCHELNYEVVLNHLCRQCEKLDVECEGTLNYVWTGCVKYKRKVEL